MGILGIVGTSAEDNLGFGRYEPKRTFHFTAQFAPVADGFLKTNVISGPDDTKAKTLTTTIKSIARPEATFNVITLEHGNEKWKVAGRSNWVQDTVEAVFYDNIPTADKGSLDADPTFSPSAIFYDWQRAIQENTTGQGSTAVEYKANIIVVTYAPDETEIERWVYHGAWPNSVTRGNHDYGSEEALTVTVQFTVDKIYRVDTGQTTPPGAGADTGTVIEEGDSVAGR